MTGRWELRKKLRVLTKAGIREEVKSLGEKEALERLRKRMLVCSASTKCRKPGSWLKLSSRGSSMEGTAATAGQWARLAAWSLEALKSAERKAR